jgi:hypothetical protein
MVPAIRRCHPELQNIKGSKPRSQVALHNVSLRFRYRALNEIHYEAAWTDSWCHRRCMHTHKTLLEASECALPTGAGWYVVAVERGEPRELMAAEDKIVDAFRFGKQK